jgi:glycosyltransferase involved in cell wall biosynthesis
MRNTPLTQSPARVTVLLSTYNGERYLGELLGSVARQSCGPSDLYVRDDGSTDGTWPLLQALAKSLNVRTSLVAGKNVGVAASFFELLKLAGDRYDYYLFCDQDDGWDADKIAAAVHRLSEVSPVEPAMYAGRVELVDERLEHLGYLPVPRAIGFGNAVVENVATGCTICLNKAARDLVVGALPERCLVHDWWVYLVLSALGKVVYDERSFVKYRQHGGNAIGATNAFMTKWLRRIRAFGKRKITIHEQLEEFQRLFGARLSERRRALVERLLRGKRSFLTRLGLAFSPEVWRQSRVDDLIFRVLLLCNRY